MSIDIEGMIDAYIHDTEEERLPDGKFHPSSLWMCDRQAVMQARGEVKTNPPDARTMRTFKIGHMFHAFIQEAITHTLKSRFEPEFDVDFGLVTGHGDGISEEDGPEHVVWEFKSAKSLRRMEKENAPQEHHVKQVATYAVGKKRDGFNVREVRIVYFEKNSMEVLEFVIPYRVEWESMVDNKVDALAPYLQDPSLADSYPGCNGPKWLHSYCPFYPACERSTKGGKFLNAPASKEEFQW